MRVHKSNARRDVVDHGAISRLVCDATASYIASEHRAKQLEKEAMNDAISCAIHTSGGVDDDHAFLHAANGISVDNVPVLGSGGCEEREHI